MLFRSFLTTLLELLQVGYFVSVFACHFCVSFICYPECDGREKGGDIRTPISRFLSVKLGLFMVLVGTRNIEC